MKYYIIAGEASGDLHGSNLMKGLYAVDSQADIKFWGGDLMNDVFSSHQSGKTGLVRHYREGAVMGLTDVIKKAGLISANLKFCKSDILSWKPDVVILIDYPGFNMKIAKFCHLQNIRVYYYIAPKTWASREGRNKKLKKFIDKMFIVFPFEIPYFTSKGVPFIYKGNPLVDSIDMAVTEKLTDKPYIALLAGSRKGEISRMMPVCMSVVDELSSNPRYKGYEFLIAGAPARNEDDYKTFIGSRNNVRVVFGKTYSILKYADAAIINSGTASLEAALIGTPQVVCWSASLLTGLVAKYVLRVLDHVKYISLGNLILDRLAFRELIQFDFTRENVVAEVTRLVEDLEYRERMLFDYGEIRNALRPENSCCSCTNHSSELEDGSASLAVADAIYTSL